jgi:hypothetical protein
MASAAQIAADRSNVQENAAPRTPRGSAAMRRSPLRHPPAEPRSTAPPTATGKIPRESSPWESRADLSNEISERDVGGKPIPCSREPL